MCVRVCEVILLLVRVVYHVHLQDLLTWQATKSTGLTGKAVFLKGKETRKGIMNRGNPAYARIMAAKATSGKSNDEVMQMVLADVIERAAVKRVPVTTAVAAVAAVAAAGAGDEGDSDGDEAGDDDVGENAAAAAAGVSDVAEKKCAQVLLVG